MSDEEEGRVTFTSQELFEWVAILTNVVLQQGIAVNKLIADDTLGAHAAMTRGGEQIDKIIASLRAKFGEEVFTDDD